MPCLRQPYAGVSPYAAVRERPQRQTKKQKQKQKQKKTILNRTRREAKHIARLTPALRRRKPLRQPYAGVSPHASLTPEEALTPGLRRPYAGVSPYANLTLA